MSQKEAILDFIKSGKSCSLPPASDGGVPRPEYTDMIGGCFAGHPWNAGGTWPFFLADEHHPVNQAFETKEFQFSDEIYQYKGYDRTKLRVFGLDSLKTDKKAIPLPTIIRFPGFVPTAREESFTLISVTIRQLGGLPLCCGIFWMVFSGPWETSRVHPSQFLNPNNNPLS